MNSSLRADNIQNIAALTPYDSQIETLVNSDNTHLSDIYLHVGFSIFRQSPSIDQVCSCEKYMRIEAMKDSADEITNANR